MTGNLKLLISTHRSLTCALLLHSIIIIININIIIIIINNNNININIIIIISIIIIILHPSASIIGTTGRYFPGRSYFPPLDWLIVVTLRLPYPL